MHHALLQIRPPPEGIGEHPLRGQGHGVDGEIPAAQIRGQIRHEAHRVRVPVVRVLALGPEGGDLQSVGAVDHGDGAVLQTGGPGFGEHRHDLLRPGAGAHVPVVRPDAQQHIPHAAAHQIGGIAPALQGEEHPKHIFGGNDPIHEGPPGKGGARSSCKRTAAVL